MVKAVLYAGTVFRFNGASILAKVHNDSCEHLRGVRQLHIVDIALRLHVFFRPHMGGCLEVGTLPGAPPSEHFCCCACHLVATQCFTGASKSIKFVQRKLPKDEARQCKDRNQGALRCFCPCCSGGPLLRW